MDKSNVAVLLDYENVGGKDAIRLLLDLISGIGSIIEKRAYGDWSVQQRGEQDQLLQLGFSLIHQRHATSGKNSSDIKLSIDAMDLLHQSPAVIDAFVIVSSDSDFFPLVNRLRSSGKMVIVSGMKANTSDVLINFKQQGHSTFTKFLESSNEVKVVRPDGPGDVVVQFLHS